MKSTNSATIKAAIEAAANCKINLSTYHCTGWEGYANSLPAAPTVAWSKSVKIWFDTDSKSEKANRPLCRSAATYENRNAEAAKVSALIALATELAVPVHPEWLGIDKRKDAAEWEARMALYSSDAK